MNKLICPLCRNDVEEKGKLFPWKKINSEQVCCICMDNDQKDWCQLKGCTCVNSPGHKDCIKHFYEYLKGIPKSSNSEFFIEDIQIEIETAMINFCNHLESYKKKIINLK